MIKMGSLSSMQRDDILVSIVVPCFNCEKYIGETIESVLNQTFSHFELLLIDDCSIDKTATKIKKYVKKDSRVKYYRLKENSGAAYSRNHGLSLAKGRFIAFLDADDIWVKDKLERQLSFMTTNNYAFSCTTYEKIDGERNHLKTIVMPKVITYDLYLKNTIIQTSTVMVDLSITGKELVKMPALKRRQDAATWCQLLKNGYTCYSITDTLSYYRVLNDSLSSNKLKAACGTWHLYRNVEKLPLGKSIWCFIHYAYHAVVKRIYIRKFFRS